MIVMDIMEASKQGPGAHHGIQHLADALVKLSYWLELEAVQLACKSSKIKWQARTSLQFDTSTVVAYLKRHGGIWSKKFHFS